MTTQKHRVVIVGAGFSGLLTARKLREARPNDLDVTVVDATDHFLFTPRLIDALESDRDLKDKYTAPLAACASRFGFAFVHGLASHIDRVNRTVSVATQQEIILLPYDTLVLSQGAKVAFYNIPGCEDCSVWLKTWDDIERVHTRLRDRVTHALAAKTEEERREALSFVIVGGGPSGIESAFAIQTYVKRLLKDHEALIPYASFTLLQGAPQILTGFPSRMVNGSRKELMRNGIAVREGASVEAIEPTAVRLTTGERIPSGLTLWAGGIEANVIPINPEIDRGNQGMMADEMLRIEEHIFGGGDAIMFRQKQLLIPKNAQTALQMAYCLTDNILRSIDGQPLKPFRFKNLGSILTLGSTGYINVGPFAFKFPWAVQLRDIFYRLRQRQVVG
ncbi:MAG: FAD-dependent oxidoreductase [Patescibacteria group bacterium]